MGAVVADLPGLLTAINELVVHRRQVNLRTQHLAEWESLFTLRFQTFRAVSVIGDPPTGSKRSKKQVLSNAAWSIVIMGLMRSGHDRERVKLRNQGGLFASIRRAEVIARIAMLQRSRPSGQNIRITLY